MKKAILLFSLLLGFTVFGIAQNDLTPDQIRRHANELGVPYEALRRLVDSYRIQTGLANPNARGAQLLTIREIRFMHASNMLEIGSFYRIRGIFGSQNGRSVSIGCSDTVGASGWINDWLFVDTSFLINLRRDTNVDVLIGVRAGEWGEQELFIAEIALVR